jgi:hypothetical protein
MIEGLVSALLLHEVEATLSSGRTYDREALCPRELHGLLIGGALGALLGPWGAVAGAALGAGFGEAAERAKDA